MLLVILAVWKPSWWTMSSQEASSLWNLLQTSVNPSFSLYFVLRLPVTCLTSSREIFPSNNSLSFEKLLVLPPLLSLCSLFLGRCLSFSLNPNIYRRWPPTSEPGSVRGFYLLIESFSPPPPLYGNCLQLLGLWWWPNVVKTCLKCLETNCVVIWHYINKIGLT